MVQAISLVIIVAAIFGGYTWLWALTKGKLKSGTVGVTFFLVVLVAGLSLFFSERIIDITRKDVAVIKTRANEANTDAKAISDIRKRVETQQAAIDLVAKAAAEAQGLIDDIAKKNDVANDRLSTLDNTISQGLEAIHTYETSLTFINTTIAAHQDDRKAFDQLEVWSRDKQYSFSEAALNSWLSVVELHDQPWYPSGGIVWNQGIHPETFNLEELRQLYLAAQSNLRWPFLEYLMQRPDLSKKEKMQFLVDVMTADESLKAVEYAGRYFIQESEDSFKPLEVTKHLDWWNEHKDAIH